jgi:hypothetical protein
VPWKNGPDSANPQSKLAGEGGAAPDSSKCLPRQGRFYDKGMIRVWQKPDRTKVLLKEASISGSLRGLLYAQFTFNFGGR